MRSVLFIFGGNSKEHDISCKSLLNIIPNIDLSLFKPTYVGITKDNKWIKCNKKDIINNTWYHKKEIKDIIKFIKKYDVVFPIIHGNNGEDGKLQGLLELFNIKYVGCRTLASTIGMDKNASKIFFNSINIPQVPYLKFDNNLDDIIKLKFPLIIKPCNGGSSIGISIANNKQELIKGIELAKIYDTNIIVEKYIKNREFECAVLENKELIISDIGEIIYNHDFYDYEDKYKNEVKINIPAKISKKLKNQIQKYSKLVFNSINGTGLCRIDYLYDTKHKKLYLNEINTIPGFTTISMYPMLINKLGISYKELITILINNAK